MASKVQSQAPMSRLGRLVVPALEKVVKAASWRKHQRLITECKSVIDHFTKAPEKLPPLPSPSTFKREKVEQAADQPSERTGDAGVPPETLRSAKENGSEEDSTIRGPSENLAGEGTADVQAASSASEESQALSSTGAPEIGATTANPEQEAGGEAGAGTGAESAAENGSAQEEHAEQNASVKASLARSESAAAVEEAKPAVQSPDFTQQFSSGSGKESDFAWGIPARPILFDGDTPVSHGDAELILRPLQLACETSSVKIVEPVLDLVQKLVAHGHLRGEVDIGTTPDTKLLQEVFDGVCRCYDIADETVELLVLRALLTGVTSQSVHVHGETLLKIVRTCYNIFLGSKAVVNQTTAKAALTQMLVLVFRRMEADTSQVAVTPIVVADLMEPAERSTTDQTSMLFVQGFINKVVQEIGEAWTAPVTQLSGSHRHDGAFDTIPQSSPVDEEGVKDAALLDAKSWEVNLQKEIAKKASQKGGLGQDVGDELEEGVSANTNSLRRDAFLVFRALCKLSMKAPPQEGVIDPFAVRGKIVALELLKILLENAGAIFRTNERFVGAIKQYLCLSLLKNSASSLLSVFQLSCSIFMSLVARFRAGLKAEIGVFFPMIVLRVLENVAQPNYAQKMIVMRFLEKLCVDPQILVDVFVNYDCDLDSSNIFERTVNGLLKTAQGVPPSVETTLEPKQDGALRLAAVKCLVGVLRSMGSWTNKQLNLIQIAAHGRAVAVSAAQEKEEGDHLGSDGGGDHLDGAGSEVSEAVHFEQRRAYKIELQEGIALFNKKPKKGIEFLVRNGKLGGTPEEIAAFLREGRGLDKVMVGEYLGERDDTCLKVMHAYVDAHDFAGIEFDNAIRLFLSGFRLPGEAQKIDRLMEKFAQRYCKCNPKSFSSADTAYVLAYSVIMLNTDAHNPMVKQKMSKAQFIRNNRGIDENGDLPEEFLGALYDRIVKNEIKMKSDGAAGARAAAVAAAKPQGGLEAILQLVLPRRKRDVSADTSEDIIRHMQDMFKQGTGKGGTLFNAASDVEIVRPMVEVVWAPMLAAFSVPLDKSDDAVVTYQCLEGFRHAIHVAAVMQMETIRDAYITSLAKFTSLHSAADIKQKNIDAIKTLMSVAEEDGNHLADAWEHVLTCISRFEHLHQIGEGVMTDAALFAGARPDAKKARGSAKGSRRSHLPAEAIQSGAIKRGSYDSAGVGGNAAGPVTSEQIATLVSNLGLLEQIDSTEINRIFTSSERLNSEAIVEFVKAIIKVSLDELRSPAEPRIFSLTKIVEISHFNMSRIRLVWSRIWAELSDYFVTVGCAENLTVAMYAVDSLRQLAMKFLERDELANYNFQNDFLKPFVVIMRKSNSVEIRELIIRCMSQMVLARVGNVKSGWKVMFMVFTTAAADEHKNIVTLAFQTIEKIVRDYFSYITETETSTFTDCVNCLIAFTNSRFNKDVSLNAIAFLRFCALKLAEGELGQPVDQRDAADGGEHKAEPPQAPFTDRDDHLYFWFPLLAGLSELTFDPRPDVRKSSLEVLFDTLRYHGHLFSPALWERVFDSVLFPIFDYVRRASAERSLSLASDRSAGGGTETPGATREGLEMDVWLYETCTLALQLVVDLFVKFYAVVDPLLPRILGLLTAFIKRPHQSLAAIGVAAFVRLISSAGALFSPADWDAVLAALADAGSSTLPDLSALTTDRLEEATLRQQRGEALDDDDVEDSASTAARMLGEDGAGREGEAAGEGGAGASGAEAQGRGTGAQEAGAADEAEGQGAEEGAAIGSVQQSIADLRCRTAVQLLLVQAVSELYALHHGALSPAHTLALLDVLYLMAGHAHKVNSDPRGRARLQQLRALTQMADPPLLRLESEAFHAYLTLLQRLPADQPQLATAGGPLHVEARLVDLCAEVLHMYINTASAAGAGDGEGGKARPQHWAVPLGSARRRELTARSPLVVAALQAITALKGPAFEQHLTKTFFPLLTQLVGCEHSSADVQAALSTLFTQRVGPLLLGLKVGKI